MTFKITIVSTQKSMTRAAAAAAASAMSAIDPLIAAVRESALTTPFLRENNRSASPDPRTPEKGFSGNKNSRVEFSSSARMTNETPSQFSATPFQAKAKNNDDDDDGDLSEYVQQKSIDVSMFSSARQSEARAQNNDEEDLKGIHEKPAALDNDDDNWEEDWEQDPNHYSNFSKSPNLRNSHPRNTPSCAQKLDFDCGQITPENFFQQRNEAGIRSTGSAGYYKRRPQDGTPGIIIDHHQGKHYPLGFGHKDPHGSKFIPENPPNNLFMILDRVFAEEKVSNILNQIPSNSYDAQPLVIQIDVSHEKEIIKMIVHPKGKEYTNISINMAYVKEFNSWEVHIFPS